MKKENREKIIKKIFDEEFGPNLTVDEICSEIDFTHQNGVKLVKEEVKPFYKKTIFMRLCYVCLLLVCVLSTFLITKNVTKCYYEFEKTNNILDNEEIKYLNNNGYKHDGLINQMINIKSEVTIYIFIANNQDKKFCYFKLKNNNLNLTSEKMVNVKINENVFILNSKNDLQNVGTFDEDNKITFLIEYDGVANEYSIQCN